MGDRSVEHRSRDRSVRRRNLSHKMGDRRIENICLYEQGWAREAVDLQSTATRKMGGCRIEHRSKDRSVRRRILSRRRRERWEIEDRAVEMEW
jgi:hypothetical protein